MSAFLLLALENPDFALGLRKLPDVLLGCEFWKVTRFEDYTVDVGRYGRRAPMAGPVPTVP